MSMLAERKRKQKWSLNPRGNEWAQDANKFGQKMLEKMGWQHGKGLGAKENGMTEHVKISYKNDSKGMGYKETNNQWTEHDTNFSALLESLSGEVEKCEEFKVQSLEKKSQTSRARVHYHKFTRGKDLSRYSEKDLANIFGKKTLKADMKKEEEEEEMRIESGYLLNGGSMREYFKKKIPGFGRSNGYVVGHNGVLKKEESDSESELRTSFGFGFKNEVNSTPESVNKQSALVSYVAENTFSKRKAENEVKVEKLFSPMKKSRKEGERKKNQDEDLGLSNPAFNPMSTPVKVQKHVLEPIEESISEETLDMEVGNIVTTKAEVHMEHALDTAPPKQKRKTKEIFDTIIGENANDSSALETPSKKKKHKSEESGGFNINFASIQENDECSQVEENPYTVKIKKKKNKEPVKTENAVKCKSKSKNKLNTFQQNEFVNLNFDHTEDNSIGSAKFEDNPYEVKVKRKKKKESNLDFDNPNFEDYENTPIDPSEISNNLYEIKLKKKKKKKEKNQYLNPSFNDSQELSVSSLQIEENPYEVKLKSKKENSKTIMLEMKKQVNIKSKKKKSKINREDKKETGIPNLTLNLNETKDSGSQSSICVEENDLMLNVVCTPVKTTANNNSDESGSVSEVHRGKRRKSVRFSDITKELIIPNNEDLQRICKGEEVASTMERFGKIKNGVDNICFDKQKNRLDENIETISKTLDQYQAEIENDINEGKLKTVTMDDIMVGEVGNPHGENERLPNGNTKLKFKYADLNAKTPFYHLDKTGAKKSYKHLIKGDIVLKFNNSNLHEVVGYAKKKQKVM